MYGDYEIIGTDSFRFFRKTNTPYKIKDGTSHSVPLSFVKFISDLSKKYQFNEIGVEFNDRFIKTRVNLKNTDTTYTIYSRLYAGCLANFESLELIKNPNGLDTITFTPTSNLKLGTGFAYVVAENSTIKFTFKSSFNEYEITYPCKCENRFEGNFEGEYLKSMLKYDEENEMVVGETMIKINDIILLKVRGL